MGSSAFTNTLLGIVLGSVAVIFAEMAFAVSITITPLRADVALLRTSLHGEFRGLHSKITDMTGILVDIRRQLTPLELLLNVTYLPDPPHGPSNIIDPKEPTKKLFPQDPEAVTIQL